MNRKIEYLADQGIVQVTTEGVYELGSELETVKAAVDKLKEHNCKKCLFDHRQTEVIVRTMEAYDRPQLYRTLGLDGTEFMAHVFSEVTDDLKFYETVCTNRGWKVQTFDDYAAAIDWLNTRRSAIKSGCVIS
jgi:hypothetical protein